MGSDAERLIYFRNKQNRVLEVMHRPELDCAVFTAGDDHVLWHMVIHRQDRIAMGVHQCVSVSFLIFFVRHVYYRDAAINSTTNYIESVRRNLNLANLTRH
jgi:hypothetical protein